MFLRVSSKLVVWQKVKNDDLEVASHSLNPVDFPHVAYLQPTAEKHF